MAARLRHRRHQVRAVAALMVASFHQTYRVGLLLVGIALAVGLRLAVAGSAGVYSPAGGLVFAGVLMAIAACGGDAVGQAFRPRPRNMLSWIWARRPKGSTDGYVPLFGWGRRERPEWRSFPRPIQTERNATRGVPYRGVPYRGIPYRGIPYGGVFPKGLLVGVLGAAVLIAVPAWLRLTGVAPAGGWPKNSFLPWAAIVTLVAVAEEALLRGVLFSAVRAAAADTRFATYLAVGVTSTAFALLHVPLYGWAVVPLDLAVGVWLGGLRVLSGGVTAPATAHALADLAGWWLT